MVTANKAQKIADILDSSDVKFFQGKQEKGDFLKELAETNDSAPFFSYESPFKGATFLLDKASGVAYVAVQQHHTYSNEDEAKINKRLAEVN